MDVTVLREERLPSAHDVVAEIHRRLPEVDALKIQKLLYYVQGWHLAWYGKPLFRERIEAWKEGPTVRPIWETYQDFEYRPITEVRGGDPDKLSPEAENVILTVLKSYGDLPSKALSERTHAEAPWQEAWGLRKHPDWGNEEIPQDRLASYFRRDAHLPDEQRAEIRPELMSRIQAGDRDAVRLALNEALHTSS
jgi:uncharacterized phage-associated protein